MEDSNIKEVNNQPVVSDDTNSKNEGSEKKKNNNSKQKTMFEKLGTFFSDIKTEFRKIIWPSRKELVKQTVIVSFVCLMAGAIIFVMDYSLNLLLTLVTNLLG